MPVDPAADRLRANLTGLGVMITRPAHQAGNLQQRIEADGGEVFLYPLLEIRASESQQTAQLFARLDQFQIVIFVSPNAVEFGLQRLKSFGGLQPQQQVAAVGKGTAQKFQALTGRGVDILPATQFNSEGLLALPALQQVSGKNVLIIRGQSGRELLADTLSQRGAQVSYAQVYQRVLPDIDNRQLNRDLQSNRIGVISLTSIEAIDNLFRQVDKECLVQVPYIVLNTRQSEVLLERGVKSEILIADEASDSGILKTLQQWHAQHSTTIR